MQLCVHPLRFCLCITEGGKQVNPLFVRNTTGVNFLGEDGFKLGQRDGLPNKLQEGILGMGSAWITAQKRCGKGNEGSIMAGIICSGTELGEIKSKRKSQRKGWQSIMNDLEGETTSKISGLSVVPQSKASQNSKKNREERPCLH